MNNSDDSISSIESELQTEERAEFTAKMREKQANKDSTEATSRQERINLLLKQTESFSSFIIFNKKSARKKAKMDSEGEIDEDKIVRMSYQPSILVGGTLTDYQLQGLNWLIHLHENKINGILADEMGLGKTIQSLAFLSWLKEYKKCHGKFLVVVPKSTMPNWQREAKKWCPAIDAVILNPVKEERGNTISQYVETGNFELLITTFEGINICIGKLAKIKWKAFIIDEAHKIKNEKSQFSQRVRLIKSKFRLLVTGTPLQNNLHELWALLNFLLPDLFSDSDDFDSLFQQDEGENSEEQMAEIIRKLHQILKHFMLRRTKADVETKLPPKKEIHIKMGVTEIQKGLYRNLLKEGSVSNSVSSCKNILMQLRKVCNHPYLFDGIEDESEPTYGEHLVSVSSKMRMLDKLLAKLKEQGSQVLIFCQMTKMLNIIEDYCNFRRFKYCRIDGATSLEARESEIERFVKPNSSRFIFLLSTRAGGLGINLMTADTVILYDSDWNPQVDLQAMDRAHRIGQKNRVLVYRFICENTIEEKILERQSMRLKMDSLIIQQGSKPKEALTKDQMKDMIQYGADVIFKPGDEFKEEDLETILRRGEVECEKLMEEAERQANKKKELAFNFNFSSVDCYSFENENYLQKRRKQCQQVIKEHVEGERTSRRTSVFDMKFEIDDLLIAPKNRKNKVKVPKVPTWHFYEDRDRLVELKEKQANMIITVSDTVPEKFSKNLSDTSYLGDKEARELKRIIKSGFPSFTREEYDILLNLIETVGMDCGAKFAEQTGKDRDEVENYLEVFKKRHQDCPLASKLVKKIEKIKQENETIERVKKLISWKAESTKFNFKAMQLKYPYKTNGSLFNEQEDRFLLEAVYLGGYGNVLRRQLGCNREDSQMHR